MKFNCAACRESSLSARQLGYKEVFPSAARAYYAKCCIIYPGIASVQRRGRIVGPVCELTAPTLPVRGSSLGSDKTMHDPRDLVVVVAWRDDQSAELGHHFLERLQTMSQDPQPVAGTAGIAARILRNFDADEFD